MGPRATSRPIARKFVVCEGGQGRRGPDTPQEVRQSFCLDCGRPVKRTPGLNKEHIVLVDLKGKEGWTCRETTLRRTKSQNTHKKSPLDKTRTHRGGKGEKIRAEEGEDGETTGNERRGEVHN